MGMFSKTQEFLRTLAKMAIVEPDLDTHPLLLEQFLCLPALPSFNWTIQINMKSLLIPPYHIAY